MLPSVKVKRKTLGPLVPCNTYLFAQTEVRREDGFAASPHHLSSMSVFPPNFQGSHLRSLELPGLASW